MNKEKSEHQLALEKKIAWNEILLHRAQSKNYGSLPWTQWKATAAASMVNQSNKASRMQLLELNLEGDLHAVYGIKMPVPRFPVHGKLVIGGYALFHLHYEEDWRTESPPGWAPVGILNPKDPYHPNCKPALRGALCLGELPAGIPPHELVMLGYFALSLQNRVLDESDPYGVLNVDACSYYRMHPEYLPLTKAGFNEPVS